MCDLPDPDFHRGIKLEDHRGALAVGIPAAVIFISLIMQPDQTLIDGYQRTRILAWLNPAAYADNAYQQQNSIMAIGSGQLVGKGLNNNLVSR